MAVAGGNVRTKKKRKEKEQVQKKKKMVPEISTPLHIEVFYMLLNGS